MALGFVFLGIVAGFLAAAGTLVFGGGIGLAVLAYVGGGTAGTLGGAVAAVLPRPGIARLNTESRA
jgi:hypothetical protein